MPPYIPTEIWSEVSTKLSLTSIAFEICDIVLEMEGEEHMRVLRETQLQPLLRWGHNLRLVNHQFHDLVTPSRFGAKTLYMRWKPSWANLERYANSANITRCFKTLHLSEWFNIGHEAWLQSESPQPERHKILDEDECRLSGSTLRVVLQKLKPTNISIYNLSGACVEALREVFNGTGYHPFNHLELRIIDRDIASVNAYLPLRTNRSATAVFEDQLHSITSLALICPGADTRGETSRDYAKIPELMPHLQNFKLTNTFASASVPALFFTRKLTRLDLMDIQTTASALVATLKSCGPALQKLRFENVRLRSKQEIDEEGGWQSVLTHIQSMSQLYDYKRGNQLKFYNLHYEQTSLVDWAKYDELRSVDAADRIAWRSLKIAAAPMGLLVPDRHPLFQKWITPERAARSKDELMNDGDKKQLKQSPGQVRCLAELHRRMRPSRHMTGARNDRCDRARDLLSGEDPEVVTWWCELHCSS